MFHGVSAFVNRCPHVSARDCFEHAHRPFESRQLTFASIEINALASPEMAARDSTLVFHEPSDEPLGT
jgi:hypothetical protein